MRVVLVNPNSSSPTTQAIADIARSALQASGGDDIELVPVTADWNCPFITDEIQLDLSTRYTFEAVKRVASQMEVHGCIVGAFGDPGVTQIRSELGIPTVGLAQAAMLEAVSYRSRFGIVTTTPDLSGAIRRRMVELRLDQMFSGFRFTPGPPEVAMSDPDALAVALAVAARECVERDGAECVIVGGGPLAEVANELQRTLKIPVIAPVPAACRLIQEKLRLQTTAGLNRLD